MKTINVVLTLTEEQADTLKWLMYRGRQTLVHDKLNVTPAQRDLIAQVHELVESKIEKAEVAA